MMLYAWSAASSARRLDTVGLYYSYTWNTSILATHFLISDLH